MLSQLSYTPESFAAELFTVRLFTVRLFVAEFSTGKSLRQCARVDSNHGPRRYQRRALTN
jgi:hypothetical protein